MTDPRPTPQPSTPSLMLRIEQLTHEHNAAVANGLVMKARRVGRELDALEAEQMRVAERAYGRADSPSPEGAELRPSWVPFDAHPDYVYAAQQVYRWEPLDDDCRRHHGPHEGFRCNGAYGRLIEVRRGAALPEPSLDVETIRDLFGANGWYVANVDDATWVESSEWGPTLLAELARLGTGETE